VQIVAEKNLFRTNLDFLICHLRNEFLNRRNAFTLPVPAEMGCCVSDIKNALIGNAKAPDKMAKWLYTKLRNV